MLDPLRRLARRALGVDPSMSARWALRHEPGVVATRDAVTYWAGVNALCVLAAVSAAHPTMLPALWACLTVPLFAWRVHTFTEKGWTWFLCDYCYVVNVIVAASLVIDSPLLRGVAFVCATGPLLCAVLAWGNALVLHSVEKSSSVWLHGLPAMVVAVQQHVATPQPTVSWPAAAAASLGVYCGWQLVYLLATEVVGGGIGPHEQTSLRWLSASASGALHDGALYSARAVGVIAENDRFDPTRASTKVVFVTAQLVYTLVTVAFTSVVWAAPRLHAFLLWIVFAVAVWHGAHYQIHVHPKIYGRPRRASEPPIAGTPSPASSGGSHGSS